MLPLQKPSLSLSVADAHLVEVVVRFFSMTYALLLLVLHVQPIDYAAAYPYPCKP